MDGGPEALERYETLLDYSGDAVLLVDLPSGHIRDANDPACALIGFEHDTLCTKSLEDIVPPSAWHEISSHFEAPSSGPGAPFSTYLLGNLDEEAPIEIQTATDDIGDGSIGIVVIRDKREFEELEESLRQSQKTLATLMSNLPGMAYRCREADHATMEFASEGCRELTGFEALDLIHNDERSYSDLIHPDDREKVQAAMREAAHEQRPFRITYRILLENGEEKWISEQGHGLFSVFSDTGEMIALEGFASDITKQVQAERLLKDYNRTLEAEVAGRTKELNTKNAMLEETLGALEETQGRLIIQEKMASLGALTAGIAHEIKNPLNFVNNFAVMSVELAEELNERLGELKKEKKLAGDTFDEVVQLIGDLTSNASKIKDHGTRADSIVRGMLLHSRGKTADRQLTDLNALIEEDVNLAYHGMRARDATFNIAIKKDLDPDVGEVEAVPQELGRVFLNMIDNGCLAAHEKARAGLKDFAPTLTLRTRSLGDTVEIRIRDNGQGIPDDIVDKIFDPFFTTKDAGQGTGLGLSIAYDIIVQEHKGSIHVNTKIGEYTEFVITLPKTAPEGARP